jgi:hypothetical protein
MDEIRGVVFLVPGLKSLIELLGEGEWTVVGPTVRDGVVVHAEIASVDQLQRGVGDLQDGGSYRLRQRGDEAMFGHVGGPQGWKPLLFPSRGLLDELLRTAPPAVCRGDPFARPPRGLEQIGRSGRASTSREPHMTTLLTWRGSLVTCGANPPFT